MTDIVKDLFGQLQRAKRGEPVSLDKSYIEDAIEEIGAVRELLAAERDEVAYLRSVIRDMLSFLDQDAEWCAKELGRNVLVAAKQAPVAPVT